MRLLTGFNTYQHTITPILASLHWLPVCFRIDFKILLITFKARSGLAPSYITDILIPYEPARSLRSLDRALLTLPKSRLKTKGDLAFAIRASQIWNALPEEIRLAGSVNSFKSLLKPIFIDLPLCDVVLSCLFLLQLSLSSVLLILFITFLLFCLLYLFHLLSHLLYLFCIITPVISTISCNLFYRPL